MIPKDMRSKLILPSFAVGALIFAVVFVLMRKSPPVHQPSEAPPISSYENKIAGVGIVESGSKDLSLGTQKAGVVSKIFVNEGQEVSHGQALFVIDDGAQKASLRLAQAAVKKAAVTLQEASEAWHRVEKLKDKRAISQEEYKNRFFAFQKAQHQMSEAQAEVGVQQAHLDQCTVKAPRAGRILRINIRLGEYAPAAQVASPLLVMGDTDTMHVRVEIDERDVLRFSDKSPATGILRGYDSVSIPLTFVEKSPIILPKKVLMGDGVERVDTRVMQVVYGFDNATLKAYSGQQMDVFIKTDSGEVKGSSQKEAAPK